MHQYRLKRVLHVYQVHCVTDQTTGIFIHYCLTQEQRTATTLPACLQCVQSKLSSKGVTAKPKHTTHLTTALKTLKFTAQVHVHHLLDRSSIHPSVRPLVMVPKLRYHFFKNRYGRPKLDFVTHFYLEIWFKLPN